MRNPGFLKNNVWEPLHPNPVPASGAREVDSQFTIYAVLYSALIPAIFTTSPHFLSSDFM